jgi:hypothetical protein
MTTTETVTLLGIGLTFFVGLFNLIVTFRNVRKTAFINSVTASRIKYIQELRESISKFCGVVYRAYNYSHNKESLNLSAEKTLEFEIEADKLKYLIRLYLNPEDEYWDEKIIWLINDISKIKISGLKDIGDFKQKIEDLMILTQYLLKLEWEGAKIESKKGIISDVEKQALYDKYVNLHKSYVEKLNSKPRAVWG